MHFRVGNSNLSKDVFGGEALSDNQRSSALLSCLTTVSFLVSLIDNTKHQIQKSKYMTFGCQIG
jgi:hypothetical protein